MGVSRSSSIDCHQLATANGRQQSGLFRQLCSSFLRSSYINLAGGRLQRKTYALECNSPRSIILAASGGAEVGNNNTINWGLGNRRVLRRPGNRTESHLAIAATRIVCARAAGAGDSNAAKLNGEKARLPRACVRCATVPSRCMAVLPSSGRAFDNTRLWHFR